MMESISCWRLQLILFTIACLPLSSRAQDKLFSVDGTPSFSDEFEYVYSKNSFNNPEAFTKEDIQDYFELFINFKLKVREARAQGLDTLQSLINEFESYKVQLQKPYLSDQKIMDSLVQIGYDRLKEEVKASHILLRLGPDAPPGDTLRTYERIMEIREKAIAGEDFGSLAKSFSEDPGGQRNGGDLGFFTSMQMVYPFEEAAYSLKVNEVSMPVRTQFGYHILKLTDRRPSKGKVEAAHIMLRFRPGMTPEDSAAKKSQIFEIAEQLQAGFDWEELCRTFSEDQSTSRQGGVLRAFRTGEMPPSFSEVVLSLENPGDISDPFMTPYGWHIAKLVDTLGIEPLEIMKGTIQSRINSDTRAQMRQKALVQKIIRENGVEFETGLYEEVRELLPSDLDPSMLELDILSMDGVTYSLMEVIDPNSVATLGGQVENFLIELEKDKLEEKYPEYRFLLKEYWEGILLFQIMDQEVWKKAAEDSVGLTEFFESNRSNYTWKERIEGAIFRSTDPSVLDSLEMFFSQAPDSLGRQQLLSEFKKGKRINLQGADGPFERGSGYIPEVEWQTGKYKGQDGNIFYLLYIDEIKPPGPRELNEARGLVISDYQEYLEDQWVKELREKYEVNINKKVVRNVTKELQQRSDR